MNCAIPNIAELALEPRLAARETAERRAKSAAQLAFACKLGSIDASLYPQDIPKPRPHPVPVDGAA